MANTFEDNYTEDIFEDEDLSSEDDLNGSQIGVFSWRYIWKLSETLRKNTPKSHIISKAEFGVKLDGINVLWQLVLHKVVESKEDLKNLFNRYQFKGGFQEIDDKDLVGIIVPEILPIFGNYSTLKELIEKINLPYVGVAEIFASFSSNYVSKIAACASIHPISHEHGLMLLRRMIMDGDITKDSLLKILDDAGHIDAKNKLYALKSIAVASTCSLPIPNNTVPIKNENVPRIFVNPNIQTFLQKILSELCLIFIDKFADTRTFEELFGLTKEKIHKLGVDMCAVPIIFSRIQNSEFAKEYVLSQQQNFVAVPCSQGRASEHLANQVFQTFTVPTVQAPVKNTAPVSQPNPIKRQILVPVFKQIPSHIVETIASVILRCKVVSNNPYSLLDRLLESENISDEESVCNLFKNYELGGLCRFIYNGRDFENYQHNLLEQICPIADKLSTKVLKNIDKNENRPPVKEVHPSRVMLIPLILSGKITDFQSFQNMVNCYSTHQKF